MSEYLLCQCCCFFFLYIAYGTGYNNNKVVKVEWIILLAMLHISDDTVTLLALIVHYLSGTLKWNIIKPIIALICTSWSVR